MTTIGVNLSHHASICIKDNDNIEYYEEDRFNKRKYWGPSRETWDYRCFSKIKDFNFPFVFCSFDSENEYEEDVIKLLVKKYKIKDWCFDVKEHHLYHAYSGFYQSNFNDALVIVIDGGGSRFRRGTDLFDKIYQEYDSIYYLTKDNIKLLYRSYGAARYLFLPEKDNFKEIIESINDENPLYSCGVWEGETEYKLRSIPNPGFLFNLLCVKIGLGDGNDAGKAMGLSSYGNETDERNEDLAKQVQIATEKYTTNLIKKALKYDCKNIILTGGYALNCVNNYKYTQQFKDIDFFIDPVAHDGGTAIGAAVWYDNYR